jgi:hypothetical protein
MYFKMLSILKHFVTKSNLEEMHHITSKRSAAIQCSKQNGGGGGTLAEVARRRRAPTHRFKMLSEWGRGDDSAGRRPHPLDARFDV